MAVTIHQYPQFITPSDNPMVFTFSSNQTAQANFSFYVDVYINGNLIKTEQVYPTNGIYARYDISAWCSNYCDMPSLSSSLTADAENTCFYQIQVFDNYGTPPTNQSSATSTLQYAYKAGLDNDAFADYDYTLYNTDSGSGKLFVTDFPRGTSEYPFMRRTDNQNYLMLMNNLTNFTLTIRLVPASGFPVTYSAAQTTNTNVFTMVNVGIDSLIANTTLTQANINAASYMLVYISGVTEQYRIDFDDSCVFPRAKRIHWLSQLGGIDSYSFNLISRTSAKISSNGYQRVFGEWNGNAWEFNKTRSTDVDFVKTVQPMLKVESDWLDGDVQHWLTQNLFTALYVAEEGDGELIERKIKADGYEWMYNDNDMLFKETITLYLPEYKTLVL